MRKIFDFFRKPKETPAPAVHEEILEQQPVHEEPKTEPQEGLEKGPKEAQDEPGGIQTMEEAAPHPPAAPAQQEQKQATIKKGRSTRKRLRIGSSRYHKAKFIRMKARADKQTEQQGGSDGQG